jgi:predicted HNH restriction endonuclease
MEYIEAHHKEAVASLDEAHQSNPDDLVMLCANCHRMVHTRTPPLTVEELKDLLKQN